MDGEEEEENEDDDDRAHRDNKEADEDARERKICLKCSRSRRPCGVHSSAFRDKEEEEEEESNGEVHKASGRSSKKYSSTLNRGGGGEGGTVRPNVVREAIEVDTEE